MSDRTDTLTLLGEIRKSRTVLRRINTFHDTHYGDDDRPEHTTENSIVLAEVLGNYYTCVETIFLRIAQFFENSLSTGSWHRELLHRMTVEIPGVRPRVISDESRTDLEELLRFRHFRRYYLEFDYDWERLLFVERRYLSVRRRVEHELDSCEEFLLGLAELQ
jgi:hypothetical protein